MKYLEWNQDLAVLETYSYISYTILTFSLSFIVSVITHIKSWIAGCTTMCIRVVNEYSREFSHWLPTKGGQKLVICKAKKSTWQKEYFLLSYTLSLWHCGYTKIEKEIHVILLWAQLYIRIDFASINMIVFSYRV